MKTTSHHRAGHSFNKVISTHTDIRIYKSDQICTVSFWKCAKRNERRVNVTTKTVSKMTTIDHEISFAWHGCNPFPQRVHWCCAYFEVFLHWTKCKPTHFFPSTIPFCGVNFLDFLISIYSILFLSKLRHFCGLFPGRFVLGQRNKMRAGAVLTGTLCLSSVYVWFSCPFVRFLLILRMVGALLCQFVNSLQTCRFDWLCSMHCSAPWGLQKNWVGVVCFVILELIVFGLICCLRRLCRLQMALNRCFGIKLVLSRVPNAVSLLAWSVKGKDTRFRVIMGVAQRKPTQSWTGHDRTTNPAAWVDPKCRAWWLVIDNHPCQIQVSLYSLCIMYICFPSFPRSCLLPSSHLQFQRASSLVASPSDAGFRSQGLKIDWGWRIVLGFF